MYTEQYDQWIKANEWSKPAAHLWQRLSQQQISLVGNQVARLSEQMKRFTQVKKPEDFLQLQKDCLHENVAAAIECMQSMLLFTVENMEEMTKSYHPMHTQTTATSNASKNSEKNKS